MTTITNDEALLRIKTAYADRARIVAGWCPSEADLAGTDTLHRWVWDTHPQHGLRSIRGYLTDEVRVSTPYRLTSPIVAVVVDEAGRGYARTWSRFYRLAETREQDLQPGLFTTRDEFHTDEVAFRCGYRHPPAEVQPTTRIGENNAPWQRLWDWFDENTKRGSDAILVYIARKYGVSTSVAYMDTDSLSKSRYQDPEFGTCN